MDGLRVRYIRRDELDELLALYEHLHEEGDLPPPDRGRLEGLWDAILADPRIHYFVGEFEGGLISSCTLDIVPNLTRGARPYGLVENVVTHAAYRRRGFATAVLREAQRVAWEQDCYKVMLLTGAKEEATLRFYQRAGFERGVKTGFIAHPPAESPS